VVVVIWLRAVAGTSSLRILTISGNLHADVEQLLGDCGQGSDFGLSKSLVPVDKMAR